MLYFKELLEIGARLIQIKQVLQIGEKLLQVGAAPVVTNRGNSYYKSGQNYYKLGQLLQVGAELLKIGAGIANWGNYYISVQSNKNLVIDL